MANEPDNLELMVAQIEKLLEKYPDGKVPYEASIIPTHKLFLNLCQRVIALEKALTANK